MNLHLSPRFGQPPLPNNHARYDALHRVLSITYPSGPNSGNTPGKYFVYDAATVNGNAMSNAKARLAEAYTATCQTCSKITDEGFSYTARGEVQDVYESTPHSGGYFWVSQSYWADGAPDLETNNLGNLPGITDGVDGEGRVSTVSAGTGQNPVSSTTYNVASEATQVNLGSGDNDAFSFDPNTFRMTLYQFNVNGQSVTGVLTWNANGTLQKLNITDAFNAANTQNCAYSYDDLARIASGNCGSVWAQTFSYDAFGNITKAGSSQFQPGYNYQTNQMSSGASYDANGDVLSDSLHSYAWDVETRPTTLDSVTVTIDAYTNLCIDIDRHDKRDADGNKVNAADEEREVLRSVAEKIAAFLNPAFGPCVFADSGNGFHLNWKLGDIEPGDGQRYYRAVLNLLKRKFESPDVNCEIDASLADDTQVVTVRGTWNRKYPELLDRPQRQSKVLFLPDRQTPIKFYDLEIFLNENKVADAPLAEPEERPVPGNAPRQEADAEWLEDYGVPHLIGFWSPLVAYEEDPYDKSGETHHPIAPCPCHEDEEFHEHSHHRDCEIIEFADGGIGISCFSGELSLKQVIAKMNAIKGEKYPHRVFAEETDEQIAEAFGVESADANSAAEQKAEADARKAEQDAFESSTAEQPELKYPQLAFPYDALPEGRFKKLVDKACEGGLSPGLVVPAIMALASSLPEQDRVEGARVNMYVTLLSMVGAGKDTAIDRAGAVLGLRTDDAGWSESSCSVYTPSGERSVAMCIGDQPGTKENPARIPGPRTHCMITYELDETLRKNKGETSGVFSSRDAPIGAALSTTPFAYG
jgi:hypothetical protein